MLASMNKQTAASNDNTPLVSAEWIPGQHALRDTWFPIAHSPHVSERPIRRIIHSQPYYLWREGNNVKAAEYAPNASIKKTSEFTAGSGFYPVLERYGYVWVWYGNPDNASEELIPNVPYLPRAAIAVCRVS